LQDKGTKFLNSSNQLTFFYPLWQGDLNQEGGGLAFPKLINPGCQISLQFILPKEERALILTKPNFSH